MWWCVGWSRSGGLESRVKKERWVLEGEEVQWARCERE